MLMIIADIEHCVVKIADIVCKIIYRWSWYLGDIYIFLFLLPVKKEKQYLKNIENTKNHNLSKRNSKPQQATAAEKKKNKCKQTKMLWISIISLSHRMYKLRLKHYFFCMCSMQDIVKGIRLGKLRC